MGGNNNIDVLAANPYIGALSSAVNIYSDIKSNIDFAKSWDIDIPSAQTDEYGRPIYNLGESRGQLSEFDPQDLGKGMIARGAASGAMAGAAFSPIGAAIGGVVGGISGAIGRRRTRKIAEQRKSEELSSHTQAQTAFNTELSSYDAAQDAAAGTSASNARRRRNLINVIQ